MENNEESFAQISLRMDDKLKKKYDIWCVQNDTSKTDDLINHIKKCVGEDVV